MPRYSRLGMVALAAVITVIGVDLLLTSVAGAQTRFWFGASVRLAVYAVAAITAGMAAHIFGWWREDIGRPWTLFTIEFSLLFVNYAIRRVAPDAQLVLDGTIILINLIQVAAFWLLSRTLQKAGIGFLMDRGRRIAFTAGALLIAVAISHASIVDLWRAFEAGNGNLASVIALLADIITFTLIAPLAMSMIVLRGGQVFWIFAFFTISVLGWMFNESGGLIAGYFGGGADVLRTTRMAGIAAAALFSAAAAGAQCLAARQAMKGAPVRV